MSISKKLEITGDLIVRNSILNFVAQGISLPAIVFTFPYIIHHLGASRFGIYALLRVLIDYFGICELGLGGSITKYIAEARGNNEADRILKLYRTSLAFIVFMGLMGMLFFYFFIPQLVGHFFKIETGLGIEMNMIIRIGSPLILIILVKSLLNGVMEAYQRFDLINIIRIPYFIVISIVPVLAVYFGCGLRGIVIGIVITELITLVGYYLLANRLIPKMKAKMFNPRSFMPILTFGWWLSINRIIAWIMLNIQNILIGMLISASAITYYNVPYSLVSKMAMIGASITPIIFSASSFLYGRHRETVTKLVAYSLKYTIILYGLPTLICVFFAKEILILWLGNDFKQSIVVMQMLAIGAFSCGMLWVFGTLIQSINKPKLVTLISTLQLPIDIFATWVLTKHYGILGAALAWSSLRLLTVIVYYFICGYFNIYKLYFRFDRKFLQEGVLFTILFVLIFSIKHYLPLSIFSIGLNVLVLILGYIIIIWNYSIEKKHKTLFMAKFRFAKSKIS